MSNEKILAREHITIRTATSNDLDRIMELEERNWPPARRVDKEEFQKRLETFPEGFLVLIDVNGHIVGMSTAFLFTESYSVERLNETPSKTVLHNEKGTIYYLHAISVDKDFRHRDLGTALVQEHEKNAMKFGLDKMYLIAAEEEFPFYNKLGYNKISSYSTYKDTKMAGFEKKLGICMK